MSVLILNVSLYRKCIFAPKQPTPIPGKQLCMFETIIKGFIIGLLISSPMGPINMLTIQRTLNRGRWHGFATGMGTMLSDLAYALITLVGIGFASDFLTENEPTIQLVGSIILVFFGFGVFRSHPLKDWAPGVLPEETRYFKDFISAFLLTFSNVAIILVCVSLFARFTFNPLAEGGSYFAVGMTAMGAAAFLWWFFLTMFISRLRKHFNRKGLMVLNRTVGAILMLVGAGGVFLSLFPNLF